MIDDLAIDESGRFQLEAEELADFVRYLRDNEVPCDVEEPEAFHAGEHSYGMGRLHHLYDADTAVVLYRKWRLEEEARLGAELRS